MGEVIIKVPASIHKPIEVTWAGGLVVEPLGVTEIRSILDMALRARIVEKRNHGEAGNFYGATDNIATPR